MVCSVPTEQESQSTLLYGLFSHTLKNRYYWFPWLMGNFKITKTWNIIIQPFLQFQLFCSWSQPRSRSRIPRPFWFRRRSSRSNVETNFNDIRIERRWKERRWRWWLDQRQFNYLPTTQSCRYFNQLLSAKTLEFENKMPRCYCLFEQISLQEGMIAMSLSKMICYYSDVWRIIFLRNRFLCLFNESDFGWCCIYLFK